MSENASNKLLSASFTRNNSYLFELAGISLFRMSNKRSSLP